MLTVAFFTFFSLQNPAMRTAPPQATPQISRPGFDFAQTQLRPLGKATTFEYDNEGHLIRVVERGQTPSPSVSSPRPIATYHYDATGKLVRVVPFDGAKPPKE